MPVATEPNLNPAVKAARCAFPSWVKTPIEEGKRLVMERQRYIRLTRTIHRIDGTEDGKAENCLREGRVRIRINGFYIIVCWLYLSRYTDADAWANNFRSFCENRGR